MSEPVKESVDVEELLEALEEYAAKANASPRVRQTAKGWTCRIHIEAADMSDARFTYLIHNGESQPVEVGLHGVPDLIVHGHSFDLAEIFWGDANPVSNYMQGAITTRGRAEDVMRLDAMSLFIFLNQ